MNPHPELADRVVGGARGKARKQVVNSDEAMLEEMEKRVLATALGGAGACCLLVTSSCIMHPVCDDVLLMMLIEACLPCVQRVRN